MPKGTNQKFKLYRLAQIMQEQTDDEHYITMPEIMEGLAKYEVTADRKSIYTDLRDLSVLGIEVEGEPIGNRYHYHVINRTFELLELKLLVDAIQSSKFITEKKSNALIKKLETLVSKYDAQKLQRQVFVSGRIKTMNESIYYTVDAIHNAISENKKIKFQYYQWNIKKEMELRHNGAWYHISPWGLSWDDENYYLVGYDSNVKQGEYFSFMDETFSGDFEKLKEAFRWSNAYLWLLTVLKENEGCLYYGVLSEKLHNAMVSDPKPYRRDVKKMLSNLLLLIQELNMEEITIDRPNYSQRVRLTN